jgi:hypothetical protein
MSASCSIDKNRLEYQALKNMSGISDFKLDTFVYHYYKTNGRFPELDEIPRANSTKFFKDQLRIEDSKDFSFTDSETILKYTNKESIEEALPILNNKFRDLEIDLIPIGQQCIVDIKRKPSKYNITALQDFEVETEMDSNKNRMVMNNILSKLNKLYGTDFVYGTTEELV